MIKSPFGNQQINNKTNNPPPKNVKKINENTQNKEFSRPPPKISDLNQSNMFNLTNDFES